MKTILFNGEQHPVVGDTYRVVDVYTHYDGIYGPQTAVILEKHDGEKIAYARKHLVEHLREVMREVK